MFSSNNNGSTSKTDSEKTDSWSFSFDYQRFSAKNKPKSLLGRRSRVYKCSQEKENAVTDDKNNSMEQQFVSNCTPLKFQNVNGPSLTHPVNPNVTPIHNFSRPTNDSHHSLLKKELFTNEGIGKSCQRRLGASTPFRVKECHSFKDISSSCDQIKLDNSKLKCGINSSKEVSKDISDSLVSSNFLNNKVLNKSFIYEDEYYPLPEDISLTNEPKQLENSCLSEKINDLSNADNNSCFLTAHEVHPDFSSLNQNEFNFKTPRGTKDSICFKTPGRNLLLFSVSQSPFDPLTGILNEDNESSFSDHSVCNTPQRRDDKCIPSIVVSEVKQSPLKKVPSQKSIDSVDGQDGNPEKGLTDVKTPINVTPLLNNPCSQQRTHIVSTKDTPCNGVDNPQNSSEIPVKNLTSQNTPSNIFKDPTTVVVNNQKGKITHHHQQVSTETHNHHQEKFPVDLYSKLIVKPQPQNIIYVNDRPYAALSLLGRGGSSEVYQVLEENNSSLLAIKCVNLATVEDSTANGYLNEIELLSKLQGCPSVIKMFDHEYVESIKMLYVVMEKGDTDFSKLLKEISKIKKIPMSMIIYYWTEMLSAVKDIHDKGVIHSDLKPGNFLLVSGRLKLIDFGIASSLQGDMTSVEKDVIRGTFNYISPEAITAGENRCHKINYKSDVWSLGCILYNLLFGCTPFSHITNTLGKFQAIADPNFKIKLPKERSHVPPALDLSVRWCLIKNAKCRPTVDQLLKLADHAISMPQIDNVWYQCIMQEFPDCNVTLEEINE